MNTKPEQLTAEETKFILRNYGPMNARQIGEKLGRSASSIRKFVKQYDEGRGAR